MRGTRWVKRVIVDVEATAEKRMEVNIRAGRRVRALWLVAPLVLGLSLMGRVDRSLAQTINFYHGTDCETAHTIARSEIRPYYAGSLIDSGQGEWTRYTDLGQGFYTHTPENKALVIKWANRTSKNNRKPQWGVVTFAVPQNLLVQVPLSRILHFQIKRDRPYNAPWGLSWLEFIEVNRHLRQPPPPGIFKPDDYYYGQYYDWIQGPIWAPRDSGIPHGGKPLPDHIHQRNWMGFGLNILNQSWRYVECGDLYDDPDDTTPTLTGFRLEFIDIIPNRKPDPNPNANPKWQWTPGPGGGAMTLTGKGPTYSVSYQWTGPGQQIGPDGVDVMISITINPPQPSGDLAAGIYVQGEGIELVGTPTNYAEVYKVARNGQSDGGPLTVKVKPPANAGGEVALWVGAKFGPGFKYRYKVVR